MSAATFHKNIRAGIRQKLLTLSGLPKVSWEAKSFIVVKGTPFISESFRPISSVVRATGVGGTIAHTITANFVLYYPSDTGTTTIDATAGSLLQLFRPGTSIVYESDSAVVQQAERQALMQEADWVSCPVIITMVGHTVN